MQEEMWIFYISLVEVFSLQKIAFSVMATLQIFGKFSRLISSERSHRSENVNKMPSNQFNEMEIDIHFIFRSNH